MLRTRTKRRRKQSLASLSSKWRVRINYLQIAAVDLRGNATNPDLPSTRLDSLACYAVTSWFLIWDPTQSPRGLGGGLDSSEEVPEGGAAAATAAVVVGVALVVLTIWGVSTIANNVTNDATVDEIESVNETNDNFNYDRCAALCMLAYNGCMGVEYYNNRCRPAAKKKCSDIYDACILGCSGGIWPTETPGVRFY